MSDHGGQSGDRLACRVGGLDLLNPIICGSGEHVMTAAGIEAALASGVSAVIAKSVNARPEAGKQLAHAEYALIDEALREIPSTDQGRNHSLAASIFCRSGLQQASEEWFAMLAELDRTAAASGQYVAASIVLSDLPEASDLASMADEAGLRILEFNIGAPHSAAIRSDAISSAAEPERVGEAVERIRKVFAGSLWIKLTGMQADVSGLAAAAEAAGADAVCVAGRLLGLIPDIETLQPVLGTVGGYGGRWALPLTCRHLALARQKTSPGFSLLGTNGARSGLDAARLLLAGASAVEICSLIYLRGFRALTGVIAELDAWLGRKGLAASDVVGLSAERLKPYTERLEKHDEWKKFVPDQTLGRQTTTN